MMACLKIVRMGCFLLGLGALLGSAACVGVRQKQPMDRVVGIVEVPGFFGGPGKENPPKTKALRLFQKPSFFSQVAGVIHSGGELDHEEFDYEAPGALVFAQSGLRFRPWYYVKGEKVSGWLPPSDAARFHSYESLVRERLTYLVADWDGRVWDAPGYDQPSRRPPLPKRTAADHPRTRCGVDVQDSRTVQGQLWFKVQLRSLPDPDPGSREWRGACGWVPAYSARGEIRVWFFSRGC